MPVVVKEAIANLKNIDEQPKKKQQETPPPVIIFDPVINNNPSDDVRQNVDDVKTQDSFAMKDTLHHHAVKKAESFVFFAVVYDLF